MLKLFLMAFCVHLFLMIAVIDTYFRSPIESNLPLTNSTNTPPSKRIVIIIVDGLKARAIFEKNQSTTPFLTSIMANKSSWGISWAKPPTESRVGHTAILTGFREDPRSILNSWQHYPVSYDSVLEHANHAWVLAASQKMVDTFGRYTTRSVEIFNTPSSEELGRNQWSVSTFISILNNSTNAPNLSKPKNMFVILLPELDWYGHHQPENYSTVVSTIDNNVEEIVKITQEYFQDNLTTFMFTSDHGMYKRLHDATVDDVLATPFIAWGAGMKIDPTSKDLDNIDIASLISTLLGVYFPTNNLGKVPWRYLDIGNSSKMEILSRNLLQVFNVFQAKKERLSRHMLTSRTFLNEEEFHKNLSEILAGNKGERDFEDMHNQIVKAIRDIQCCFTCDILTVSCVYLVFWLLYLILVLAPEEGKECTKHSDVIFSLIFLVFHCFLLIFYRPSNISFIFCCLPLATFILCFTRLKTIRNVYKLITDCPSPSQIVIFISFLLSIVLGLHLRALLSLTAILMIPVVFFFGQMMKEGNLRNIWIILCLVLAGFPLISPDIEAHMDKGIYYVIGTLIWHFLVACIFRRLLDFRDSFELTNVQVVITSLQLVCSLGMSICQAFELVTNVELVFYVSFFPVFLIPFSMKIVDVRMITVLMAFATVYTVGAKPYALIFLTFFSMFLLTWKIVETERIVTSNLRNFRNIWIVIGVSILGFLGIVNYWSIKIHFILELDFIHLFKLLTPLIYSCCIFRCIVSKSQIDFKLCFIVMEIIFGLMTFYFMRVVRNEGTWADMGTSFFRFCVVNWFSVVILFVYFLSYVLMNIGSSDLLEKLNLLLK